MESAAFEVPQFYETAIAMRAGEEELDSEFRFLCVPKAAIHPDNQYLLDNPSELSLLLGLGDPVPLQVAQLPDAIFALLRAEHLEGGAELSLDLASNQEWLSGQRGEDPDASLFAEYSAFADVVPFEQSKLSGTPLASLAMKSYEKAGQAAKLTPAHVAVAVVLGPHAAVAFLAVVGGVVVGLLVVDSVGVVVGMAKSSKTVEIVKSVRHGIGRLIRAEIKIKKSKGQSETAAVKRGILRKRATTIEVSKGDPPVEGNPT